MVRIREILQDNSAHKIKNPEFKTSKKRKAKDYTCCFCGEHKTDIGNNPAPLKTEGRCCNKCNSKVLEARRAKYDNFK